jgi:hypothetical protein
MADSASQHDSSAHQAIAVIAWLWVLIPFIWGVWQLIIKVIPLFSS